MLQYYPARGTVTSMGGTTVILPSLNLQARPAETSAQAGPYASPMHDQPALPRWIWWLIVGGASAFILALVVSGVFDPSIRVLHTLQALLYLGVILLARRNNAWAFGAGAIMAAFWDYINLFVTTNIPNGVHQLVLLLTTGHVSRPDQLIGIVAGGGHAVLLVGCVAGFLNTRPTRKSWMEFVGGGAIAIAYFLLIIVTTGRQYLPLMHRVFHF
jgi:hypothetical protein